VLFNEPKLLKSVLVCFRRGVIPCFSALQRAEIAEISRANGAAEPATEVSVLFNEPKLLKSSPLSQRLLMRRDVSVLFNEPKLLKSRLFPAPGAHR